jgi:DNA-binding NarL/FixJ family response regulator
MNGKLKTKGQDDLTLKLLAKLGNPKPSQQQVELAKSLLLRASINKELVFHKSLTEREISCLLLAAKGTSIEDTAKLLKVVPSTVKTWRSKINRKLSCASITQAVFEGIRYGYLHTGTK